MGNSPNFYSQYYRDGATEKQIAAIDIIVRNPEYLAQWLTNSVLGEIPKAYRPPYFADLDSDMGMAYSEFHAVNWLIVCELGDGCPNNSLNRFSACMGLGFYCGDVSISDEITARFGQKRAQVIRAAANAFIADLGARGVAVFNFPKKKVP